MEGGEARAAGTSAVNPRVKVHRRLSSVFVPASAPIFDRTATAVSRAVAPVSSRIFHGQPSPCERLVEPNSAAKVGARRYELYNFRKYCGNKVVTTKYNLLTFVPKNLFEQFHRIANMYFVAIAAMNWIPALQAFNRYLGIIPVAAILILTAIKDAYEDSRRRRLDNRVNGSYCHVWDCDKGRFRKMQWQYLIVGDFVHLSLDEVIPADILLLRSSDSQGICFVETSNLDGETSLKQRRVPASLSKLSGEEKTFDAKDFNTTVVCEKPNSTIHHMTGRVTYEDGRCDALSRDNMLLRGCQIRNTTFVEGIVLYAGNDTKAMMNNSGPRYKRSSLELLTNRFILFCVLILAGMCLFGGLGTMLWLFSYSPNTDSIIFIVLNTHSAVADGAINFASSILNYQILIPLSLYISVELVKLFQIFFISSDIDLYYEKADRAMECRSLNIPEELGQIQYVLSDKTGTLTENMMVFRCCAIGGVDYGEDIDFSALPKDLRVDNVVTSRALKTKVHSEWNRDMQLLDFFTTMAICNTVVVNSMPRVDSIDCGFTDDGVFNTGNSLFHYSLQDPLYPLYSRVHCLEQGRTQLQGIQEEGQCDLVEVIVTECPESPGYEATEREVPTPSTPLSRSSTISQRLHLGIAHLGSRLRRLSGQQSRRKRMRLGEAKESVSSPLYEAESPDELALVYAARAYGFSLLRRSTESITLTLPFGLLQHFEILKVLPFDSTRKKMSIIVRKDDEIVLLSKGADSEMFNALSRSFLECTEGKNMVRRSRELLDAYSTRGLRTLCLSKRYLTPAEFDSWALSYATIENDISNPNREEDLMRSMSSVERDMTLLGVTAIEDRLQDGVEDTIVSLRRAGIQVWLLTGDKMETALNVARSCGLFPSVCDVFVIDNEGDVQTAHGQIFGCSDSVAEGCEVVRRHHLPFCVLLSTHSFELLQLRHKLLLEVVKSSLSVLCYRMTPSDKAEIVRTAKKLLKGKVLAIGDGANDVPMIQCADVGIGISGQEGMQAVMAADFAIARFRYLHKLLLVHGHWCNDRLASTFLYFLYKNALFVFVIFWGQIFNGFSGTAPMDQIYMMTYPIIFTGAQPLIFGVYDQLASSEVLSGSPQLYAECREGKLYRGFHFWLNILDAVWQSVVIYFVAHMTYWDTDAGNHTFGFLLATSTFLVNTLHLCIEVHCWTVPMFAVFVFFVGVHFAYFRVEDALAAPFWNLKDPPVNVSINAMATFDFWGALLLSIAAALLPRFVLRVVLNTLWPSSVFVESVSRRKAPPPSPCTYL